MKRTILTAAVLSLTILTINAQFILPIDTLLACHFKAYYLEQKIDEKYGDRAKWTIRRNLSPQDIDMQLYEAMTGLDSYGLEIGHLEVIDLGVKHSLTVYVSPYYDAHIILASSSAESDPLKDEARWDTAVIAGRNNVQHLTECESDVWSIDGDYRCMEGQAPWTTIKGYKGPELKLLFKRSVGETTLSFSILDREFSKLNK